MKTFWCITLLAALFGLTPVAHAGNSDVDITCTAKKTDDGDAGGDKNEGGVSSSSEKWGYAVTIENKAFNALTNLEVKYVIFYKQEQIGSKGAARVQRLSGSNTINTILPHEKGSFTSDSVELKKSVLNGNYIFSNGGKPKSEDTLTGIWIRIYQNGNLFAEFIKPPSLSNKEKFDG